MERAIREGVIQILNGDLATEIHSAYGALSRANELTRAWVNRHHRMGATDGITLDAVLNAIPRIKRARDTLLRFLQSEPED